ncbi:MAG: cytochrome c [Pirellulales bacterium]|nr:cytochrome c [Pirellulales bacterium]
MWQRFFFAGVALLLSSAVLTVVADADSKAEKRAATPTQWEHRVSKVFFPDAFKELKGTRPDYEVGSRNSSATAPTTSGDSGATGGTANSADGTFAWSKLVSAVTLQDEIKSHQPLLAADVKSLQVFKGGSYKNARRSFSVLAVAFAIVNEYDKESRWKNQAAAARDLFARAGFNCKTATDQSFNEAKLRWQDLGALLQGETVTPPSSVEPKNQWGKVANRAPLMIRLELAQQDRLAPWTANAGDFNKSSDAIQHEAELIAAIAEVLTRDGQDDAGDETYVGYAKAMQHAAQQIVEAAKSGNAEAARTAAGVLNKSCNACHADYRS